MDETITKHGQANGGYLRGAFENFGKLIADARRLLSDEDYDTIVATGISGTVAAAALASAFNKHLLIVRKVDDKSNHSGNQVEGVSGLRYLFVDDHISTGSTRRRVQAMVSALQNAPRYVGTYTYGVYGGDARWQA